MLAAPDMNAFKVQKNNGDPKGFCIIHIELDDSGKPVDWTFIYANEDLARLEGKTVDELIGHRFFEIFPERNGKRLIPHFEAAYLGKSVSFDDISEEISRYVHIDVFPTGELGYCACVLSDIKEVRIEKLRQQNEETEQLKDSALAQVLEKNEIIDALSNIYTTIVVDDLQTHRYKIIKSVSLMDEATGGEKEGDLNIIENALLQYFVHPDMRDEVREFISLHTMEERMGNKNTIVKEFRSPLGRHFRGRFIVHRRDESGRLLSVLFVAREITLEKKKDLELQEQLKAAAIEAEKANVSKTNFLRRMSHDIRTPLNGIIGMLKIMDNNKGNKEKYEECMDKIMRSSDYLLAIVNNVLDVSKMESGEIELEHKPFDLSQLLLNTLPIIATNASRNSVLFIGELENIKLQHKYVIGSPVHINRVLMNIASNAIKYNRKGGKLTVYCDELKCDGMQATYEFVCEDTGLGMSEEFQKRAFEPFSREGKTSITNFGGSGLGLSIVREIVNKMGGHIELKSKENEGTTIRIVLTLSLDKDFKQTIEENESLEGIDFSGRKALLVEDNEINSEIACIMLEEMGMHVTCARNGREAVDIFAKSEPYTFDFIFMDMMMPVMDGLEATKIIRSQERVHADKVPIIAMTANAFAEDRKACLDAGMDDHIGKPIESLELKKVMRKFVK